MIMNNLVFIPEKSSTIYKGRKLRLDYGCKETDDNLPVLDYMLYAVTYRNDILLKDASQEAAENFMSYPTSICSVEKLTEGFVFRCYLGQKKMHCIIDEAVYNQVMNLSNTLLVDSLGIDFSVFHKNFDGAEKKVLRIFDVLNDLLKKHNIQNYLTINNISELYYISSEGLPYKMTPA